MSIKRPDVDAGLKDFQRKTVAHVYKHMYTQRHPARRFLVADEVGLGKTLVARGLIARVIAHFDEKVDHRIDIIYVCSNATIAQQNISRLNVTGEDQFNLASRITLLPLTVHNLKNNRINFISITPSTSLDLKNSVGTRDERVLLYWLVRRAWGSELTDGAASMNVFQGNIQNAKRFRSYVKNEFPRKDIDAGLARDFVANLREHDKGRPRDETFRGRFRELKTVFSRSDIEHTWQTRYLRNQFIGDLRNLLAKTCIEALEPDLVILDEFQRFKRLLDGGDPASDLAQDLFTYSDARVLLLSATPYKMYTMHQESEDEDHYEDLMRTLEFLAPRRVEAFKQALDSYRGALHKVREGLDRAELTQRKEDLERLLRGVMVRSERLAITPDRNGMLEDRPVVCDPPDEHEISSLVTLQRIADRLDAGSQLEYWKSAPYLLNFMEGYKVAGLVKDEEKLDGGRRLAEELSAGDGVLPPWEGIANWNDLDLGSSRLRRLAREYLDAGAWKLLWMPPSLPYYQPQGVYADEKLRSLTKRLIFSSWSVVPKALATLLTYEAERRMVGGDGSPRYLNTPEDRAKVPSLLRWQRAQDRIRGMSLLTLVYPSVTLAEVGDPVRHVAKESLPAVSTLLDEIESELRGKLAPFLNDAATSGPVDDGWYWASPLLLDGEIEGVDNVHWLSDAGLREAWGAEDSAESSTPGPPKSIPSKPVDWDSIEIGTTYNVSFAGKRFEGYVVVGMEPDQLFARHVRLKDGWRRVGPLRSFDRSETKVLTLQSQDPGWQGPTPETMVPGRYYSILLKHNQNYVSFLLQERDGEELVLARAWRDRSTGDTTIGRQQFLHINDLDPSVYDEMDRWESGPGTGSALDDVLVQATDATTRSLTLGRPPDDLISVLARVALAGPATCALRALNRVSGSTPTSPVARTKAAGVAWTLRNLFNLPEVSTMLRRDRPEDAYWREVVDYCTAGNLQATLDEYAHVLPEWLGIGGKAPDHVVSGVADAMVEAASLRAAPYSVDELRPNADGIERTRRRMRGRFAVRFGDEKSEDGAVLMRANHMRSAFNSPFWPFVLITTSIGQEGLDFHLYCHAVVHWNLPSNPVDLEQREGRVHRYKGHAVRRNLAQLQRRSAGGEGDPWARMFDAAVAERDPGSSDLVPFWVLTAPGGAQVERVVPLLPLSREVGRLEDLRKSLGAYRVVFGQPRQEDLLAYLQSTLTGAELEELVDILRIDLSPD